MNIKAIMLTVFLPMILSTAKEALVAQLDKLQEESPEWYKTAVIVGHRLLSEHGAELVANTENVFDDKAVSSVTEALETSAAKYGVVLQ